jgi:hypothetical protein
MFKPTFALATLGTMLAVASCTLITDVDRTKIPTEAGAGTSGSGGSGGGSGGTSGGGSGGDAGDGSGGTPEGGSDSGGSSGKGGSSGGAGEAGEAGSSGAGGSGGAPVSCAKATGSISIIPSAEVPVTNIADGDTFTLRDGVNDPVVFEFDFATQPGVTDGRIAIAFDGSEDEAGLAGLIETAINAQTTTLGITANFEGNDSGNGGAGAGGEGGTPGAAGAPDGMSGGAAGSPGFGPGAVITLVNDAYGALGNQKVDDTVGNPNFKNQDMTGGDAVSCDLSPTMCDGDEDCATSCNTDIDLCE